MTTKLTTRTVVSLLLMVSCTSVVFAAAKTEYKLPRELAWTKEKWKDSDKSFQSVRRNIDQMIAKGRKPDDLRKSYKASAQKEPQDAQAQFRWAYAADRDSAKQHESAEVEKRLSGVADAMAKPDSPRSYQYGRLRYLMEVRRAKWGGNWFIVEFGKRLVKRNSNDWDVKYYLTYDLLNSEDVPDRRVTALKYANQIKQAFPKRPSSYSTLGWVYRCLALETHDPRHCDIAIANYRKYLQLAPTSHSEMRKYVPSIINRIEKDKARYLAPNKKKSKLVRPL